MRPCDASSVGVSQDDATERSGQIELAPAYAANEGNPLVTGEGQNWTRLVLRVADSYVLIQERDLDTLPVVAGPSALAPYDAGQIGVHAALRRTRHTGERRP
jgi:hypothetical protein